MKKALSLLLAGVMCVGLLAGCGGQNTEDPQGSGSTPDTSDTQETGNKTSTPCESPSSPPGSRRRSSPPPSP